MDDVHSRDSAEKEEQTVEVKEKESCFTDSIDIDKTLEDKACYSNLSVQNVKSIIHHVLKDERVVQMVQKIAETGSAEDEVIFEPKLTRLRVRQAVANYSPCKTGGATVSGALSPSKTTSQQVHVMPHSLLSLQFPEESSDEEYDPAAENTKDTDDIESDILDLDEEEEEHHDQSDDETDKEDIEGSEGRSSESTPKAADSSVTPPANYGIRGDAPIEHASEGGQSLETPLKDQFKTTPPIAVHPSSSTETTLGTVHISESDLVQETAVLLASLSDTILSPERSQRPLGVSPSIPIVPTTSVSDQSSANADTCAHDAGEIAHRTRSKFPMVDKDINEIEASFVPPDVPADDSIINTPNTSCIDIDEEELHWQEWLADLMNPISTQSHEVEDDDTEYNFYADQHEDEGEEFRTDRAVKIPQKEVDELIEEILNPADEHLEEWTNLSVDSIVSLLRFLPPIFSSESSGLFNRDITGLNSYGLDTDEGRGSENMEAGPLGGQSTLDPTSAYLLESLGLHLPTNPTPKKTSMQSVQDPASRGTPEGNTAPQEGVSKESSHLSNNQMIQLWDQIQQHFQLLLQTFVLTRHEPSLVFLSQIASQALEEIISLSNEAKQGNGRSIWYIPGVEEGRELITKYDPHDPDAVELVQSSGQPPKIPIQVQEIIMNYGVFWQYPSLIPEIGFYSLDHPTSSKYFLPSEDGLLALGMDHYGSSAWKLIQQNLLPVKAPRQLNLRVKNLCSARQKSDNVVKHYKRTEKVVLPFPKEKDDDQDTVDGLRLPNWAHVYNRKRIEKEKVEGKRREKELEAMVKLVKTAGESSTQSLVGTKRSLSEQFNAVDVSSKRIKKASDKDATPTAQTKKKKGQKKLAVENSNEYNQLLYLAGLEANDKAARFAYKYLTEVKATVMDSPGVYDSFLKLVKKARERNWRPVKLYIHVCDILRPWPHLLKLFMAFVGPLEAMEANVFEEKFEFEQVKSFVNALENKYADSPLQLEEIVATMKELAEEEKPLTQEKIFSSLGPLIEAHEDLLQDLKSFIHGINLHSSVNSYRESFEDDFEEIDLTSKRNIADVDDFEEMYVADDWVQLHNDENISPSIQSKTKDTTDADIGPCMTPINTDHDIAMVLDKNRDTICSMKTAVDPINSVADSSSVHSTVASMVVNSVMSTGSTGTTSSQTVTVTCTLRPDERDSVGTKGFNNWTREDDRFLLQACLQTDQAKGKSDTLSTIANHLNRPLEEVQLRCTELLKMMKSMTHS